MSTYRKGLPDGLFGSRYRVDAAVLVSQLMESLQGGGGEGKGAAREGGHI